MSEPTGAPMASTPQPGERGRARVLVAEDSATQAAALAALLEEHGYQWISDRIIPEKA